MAASSIPARGATRRGRPRQPRKRRLRTAALVAIPCLALLAYAAYRFQASPSAGTLDQWLSARRFSPIQPYRSDYLPGTLLQISGGGFDRIAMPAPRFLGEQAKLVATAQAGDATLNLDLSGQLAGEAGGSGKPPKGETAGRLRARLVLKDVQVLSLALDTVADLVKANERVRSALETRPDNLFIILEALRVGRVFLQFDDQVGIDARWKMAARALGGGIFQGSLKLSSNGVIESTTPLVLGARVAKLNEVSRALGGGAWEIRLQPMSMADLSGFRKGQAARTSRLYSGFDLYGLVVGLGDYAVAGPRVGGQLPEAVRTAGLVAQSLRRLLPPSLQSNIRTVTSVETSPGSFDATQRITRNQLLKEIDDFVADVQQRSRPERQTAVVFYYFGHGLADGMSKNVFLVPEAFVDDPDRKVTDVAPELVRLKEVIDRLSAVTDLILILTDACRSHRFEDEQLKQAWRQGLQQHADLPGLIDAIQDESGIFGPAAVVFGGPDGVAAATVAYARRGLSATGPLAARLDSLLDEAASSDARYDLAHLLNRIQSPPSPDLAGVRGYTYMRADRRALWGSTPVVSAEPVAAANRQSRFEPPFSHLFSTVGSPPPSQPTMRSGAAVEQVAFVESGDLKDLTLSPDGGSAYVLGWDLAVYRVRGEATRDRVNAGLDAAGIAWDRSFGLVISQWDEGAFYALRGRRWARVAVGARAELLRVGGDRRLRILAPRTTTIMSVLRVDHASLVRESSFESGPGFLDAAILANGEVWVTDTSGLRRSRRGTPDPASLKLWHPAVLAADGMTLYVLSDDGRFLYRRMGEGRFAAVDLLDVGLSDAFIRESFQHGLQPLDGERIALLAGRHVLLVSLRHVNWQSL